MEAWTLERYEREFAGRHLVHEPVSYWASRNSRGIALINHNRGTRLDWATFEEATVSLARRLLALGFGKGDYLATSLPLLTDHVLLEYACFRIGVVHVPLDMRLRPPEVVRCLNLTGAKGYVFAGDAGDAARAGCASIQHFVRFTPGVFAELGPEAPEEEYLRAAARVREDDGAQVIFTTGSTGSPKPALLSHRNITCQNMCLGAGFGFHHGSRLLVNLPPSHVGGQSEILMTTLFWGGTAVLLEAFEPAASLAAIAEHRVNILGQIPAMFNYEWRLPNYSSYDLSSLEAVIHGGQQVPQAFLEKLGTMAPEVATGLGLTECAGFCTYTPRTPAAAQEAGSLGHAMPAYPMSIRAPMREGCAGEELPPGEVGHVCFKGPQTFLGYLNDPEATARTISTDGYLYTGDMGKIDSHGLRLSGRARWVIKPAGYQVFPGDVENHIAALDGVISCGVVGVQHRTLTEAIVAFVEARPDSGIDVAGLRRHARRLASYMRPLRYVILAPGQMPLNRVAKIDYVRLSEMAHAHTAKGPS